MLFRQVNLLIPGTVRRVQKNTQYQQATPLDCHTDFLSVSPPAACQGESLKPLKIKRWRNRRYEENDFICCRNIYRKCSRCNCNVHFTGKQKVSKGDGAVRKRNVAILFRLNKKEAEALDKKVKKSGLNREAYLRQLISGVVPRDAPPPDYYSMMRELHKIGNNLNQIAQKAHVLNVIDVQRYDQEVWKFNEAVRKITETVILPEKNESWQ